MGCVERPDDFETQRKRLQALSDEELHSYFWSLAEKIVTPLIEEARSHTSPSIERSVLLRMGFSSLEALRLHEERLQGGAERTCVSLRGQQLHLTSARALSSDVDLTDVIRKGHGQVDFYLVDEAAIVPCSNLTR